MKNSSPKLTFLYTQLQSMLNQALPKLTSSKMLLRNAHHFGVGKLILHYIRSAMNRIRWEQNRGFTQLQQRKSTLPKNTEQANEMFIASEKQRSLSERARMERIDNILGTHTHFHQTKLYQQRLDSDHIMDLEQLKKKHGEPSRQTLSWTNPQADVRIRYKNKRKYYQFISKLRTYPAHKARKYDFQDQTNENTINFLGKEAVYSKISLKELQLTVESMENEAIGLNIQRPFQSRQYCYFRPLFTMQLFRIQKSLYNSQMISSQAVFQSLAEQAEQIISLDEIYEILNDYDTDERVNEYLRKVENNRIEYLLSEFTYDRSENIIAIMIDLLGTNKEYCLIVKNLALNNNQAYKHRVIFNVKPSVVFSADAKSLYYIQRSPEGGWIELVSVPVENSWYKESKELTVGQNQEEIMYRCAPDKEIMLGTDSNKNYIFLKMRDVGRVYTESLFLVHQTTQQGRQLIQLIEVDKDGKCKYFYDVCPMGLVFVRFHQVKESLLKFGGSAQMAREVCLIPYKQHIQLHQQQKIGLAEQYLPLNVNSVEVALPTDFDVNRKQVVFRPGDHEFIRQIQVRASHLVMVLNMFSVYNKAILYMLPLKGSAHPHSVILGGGGLLKLMGNSYNYDKQVVVFTKATGVIRTEKVYNIWRRELSDGCEDMNRYYTEKIIVSEKQDYPIQINVLCSSVSAEQKNLPVLVYFASAGDQLDGVALRSFLEKGVMVVQFRGRGTFAEDLQHYLQGCRHNFANLMDDLQAVIQFVGNKMTKNISLYCKGEISSLVGLWFNVYFPFLFNTTVLHNGLYDLEDQIAVAKLQDFFGRFQDTNEEGKSIKQKWQKFNIFKYRFRQPYLQANANKGQVLIGSLQNLIISSQSGHRVQSRKLVHRLRENPFFRYQQVYLKQYQGQYQADLNNLSYVYFKIRSRVEQELNDPAVLEQQQQQQSN